MARHDRQPCAALLLCLALFFVSSTSAAIIAIDFGSEYLKISIVKPGRIPISIVPNEISKRKSPVAVALINGDRLVGDEAAALAVRYPDRVYTRLRDLLGRRHDDPAIVSLLEDNLLGFSVVPAPNRTTVALKTDNDEVYTAEELVASLLEYAKNLASTVSDGSPVTDCVLVVPAFWTPAQRRALLDAADLAGLNVMSLVHTHAAAALQYGIERDFTNKTENVLFYDLGAGAAQASLVRFSSYPTNGPKNDAISQFEVLDTTWIDHKVGCDAMEAALVHYFAAQHVGGAQEVLNSPRAVAKLKKQVKRTKEVLSANTEAPISVEDLLPGVDFRGSITREQFEDIAKDIWHRAAAPVIEIMARNNLTSSNLSGVELLGGCSRIPKVKSSLMDALGGRVLDMHLDADEAVVLGAGLYAANLSTIFRLRKFGMTDKAPYSVLFSLEGALESGSSSENEEPRVLVPALRKIPTKRAIALQNLTSDGFSVELSFDNSAGAVLPCCQRKGLLGQFNVSGVAAVVEKYGHSGKVALHTSVDQGGVLTVDRADAAVEVEEDVKVKLPAGFVGNTTANGTISLNTTAGVEDPSNTTATDDGGAATTGAVPENATTSASSEGAESSKNGTAGEEEPQYITKKVRSTRRIPLTISGGFELPNMTASQRTASRRALRTLRERDDLKRATAKSRNDLEAYVIAMRDKLENDDPVIKASTEEEREALKNELIEAEDWLYGEGDAATSSELQAKLKLLRKGGDTIEDRVYEAQKRPETVQTALDFIKVTESTIKEWAKSKPWLEAGDVAGLTKELAEFKEWIETSMEAQAKKAPHEDPSIKVFEVALRLSDVKRTFTRLNSKRKPIQKPAVVETKKNETETTTKQNETESINGKTVEGEETEKVEVEVEGAPAVDADVEASTTAPSGGGASREDTEAHDEL